MVDLIRILKIKRSRWLIAAAGAAIAACGLIFYSVQPALAATTITTSTSASATPANDQKRTFYDNSNNLYWAFIYNGSAIAYYNSSNGTSWTSIGNNGVNSSDFSVWYVSGTSTVYIIYKNSGAWVNKGTLSSSSISWGTATLVDSTNNLTQSAVFISRASDGHLWASVANNFTSLNQQDFTRVYRSTNADDQSAWSTSQTICQFSGTASPVTCTLGEVVPYDSSGGVIAAALNPDATVLNTYTCNTTPTCTATGSNGISVGGKFNFSLISSATSEGDLLFINGSGVQYMSYTSSAWSGATTVDSTTTDVSPSLSYNSSNGDMYAFWISSSSGTNTVYFSKKPSGSFWGSATSDFSSGTSSNLTAAYQGANRSPFIWTNGTASPYNVEFDDAININSPPNTPTLSTPSSSAADAFLTPSFSFSDTDPNSDDIQFKINLLQSNCSTSVSTYDMASGQTGWSPTFNGSAGSGLTYTSATAGSGVSFTPSSALTAGTTYCWSVSAKDPGGSNTTTTSGTRLFTTSYTPNAPTLISPSDGRTGLVAKPAFKLSATDTDSDYLDYEIQICSDSGCASVVRTICQVSDAAHSCTGDQTGWASQSQQSGTAYSSGQTAVYNYQFTDLSPNTQYWWRSYAIDPGGTNTWGSASAIHSFTIENQTTSHDVNTQGTVNVQGNVCFGSC